MLQGTVVQVSDVAHGPIVTILSHAAWLCMYTSDDLNLCLFCAYMFFLYQIIWYVNKLN